MVNVPIPVECQHRDFRGTWIEQNGVSRLL